MNCKSSLYSALPSFSFFWLSFRLTTQFVFLCLSESHKRDKGVCRSSSEQHEQQLWQHRLLQQWLLQQQSYAQQQSACPLQP